MARRNGYRTAQVVNAFLAGVLAGVALLAAIHPRDALPAPRPPPPPVTRLGLDADPDVCAAFVPAWSVRSGEREVSE